MIYLDSSAVVRLIVAGETWADELRDFLRPRADEVVATSVVGYVEVHRTLLRIGADQFDQARATATLADFRLVSLTDDVRRVASALPGTQLRSLDAIHVASAQQLGGLLNVLITYDHRMIDVARSLGQPVVSPGMVP